MPSSLPLLLLRARKVQAPASVSSSVCCGGGFGAAFKTGTAVSVAATVGLGIGLTILVAAIGYLGLNGRGTIVTSGAGMVEVMVEVDAAIDDDDDDDDAVDSVAPAADFSRPAPIAWY